MRMNHISLSSPYHNQIHLRYVPAGNYVLKVSNRNTRTRCEICSKLTIKIPERRHWRNIGFVTFANVFANIIYFSSPFSVLLESLVRACCSVIFNTASNCFSITWGLITRLTSSEVFTRFISLPYNISQICCNFKNEPTH